MKTSLSKIPKGLSGWKVTVLGAGKSGFFATLLLAKKGATVILSDSGKPQINTSEIEYFENIVLDLGQHSDFIFDADLVVVSPGISVNSVVIQRFESENIPIISEIELAYWFVPNIDIIGITGSNGKTTTTSLIFELFRNAGYDAYCGGNIGKAFSEVVLEIEKSDSDNKIIILELSSFQLERIVHFKPRISLLLNISDDHMDRYDGKIENYLQAKLNVAKNQKKNDFFIYNSDYGLLLDSLPNQCRLKGFGLSEIDNIYYQNHQIFYNNIPFFDYQKLQLKGRHNISNILAALTTAQIYQLPLETMKDCIANFQPIEHRLEYVATINGVEYYNDSKATNVESVKYALASFTKPIIVILGGKDKNSDFSLLKPFLEKYCKHAILIGAATQILKQSLKGILPLTAVKTMSEAVNEATEVATAGDLVLLSPACASFDMFDNFEHRGRGFKDCVADLEKI